MWLNWLPWRYLIRQAARRHGFLDPIALWSRLRRFAQPSEVAEPVELIRAGVIFHARGLLNTRVIQHNLDWVWPYWVVRQFDPRDESFVPRGFSATHVNQTHRNWTALGVPGCRAYPLVDPRGLVTLSWDGWSIDAWIIAEDGRQLLPSRLKDVTQTVQVETDIPKISTNCRTSGLRLESSASMYLSGDRPFCTLHYDGLADTDAWLVIAIRPYNPEGVSFVHEIGFDMSAVCWDVDGCRLELAERPDNVCCSTFADGDVFLKLPNRPPVTECSCKIGLATSAVLFRLRPNESRTISLEAPVLPDPTDTEPLLVADAPTHQWSTLKETAAKSVVDHGAWDEQYERSLETLVMLSPDRCYPGSYTYRRFWYRDATYMVYALLAANLPETAARVISHFPENQKRDGFFHSQDGEWDANGEVLWVVNRFAEMTGKPLTSDWQDHVYDGADWICKKRVRSGDSGRHQGLLPAGFSAEHFGNIDHYYWDDFWAVAGLRAAADLAVGWGDDKRAKHYRQESSDLLHAIGRSIHEATRKMAIQAIPASPYRRLDSGAVGALVAGHPLHLLPANDARLLATARFLHEKCLVHGALFHDNVHSGINAYLTLHLAQVLLHAGKPEFLDLIRAVSRLATPTGQWPEAIHPRTGGGCMGDGQHGWAAAEWILMMRSLFLREEDNIRLRLGGGIVPELLQSARPLVFGPTLTRFGRITVHVRKVDTDVVDVRWDAHWHQHQHPPVISVCVPGFATEEIAQPGKTHVSLRRQFEGARS